MPLLVTVHKLPTHLHCHSRLPDVNVLVVYTLPIEMEVAGVVSRHPNNYTAILPYR